jgi:type I restriction enzyme R subunit
MVVGAYSSIFIASPLLVSFFEHQKKQLAKKGPTDGVPSVLHGNSEATVIFSNLGEILAGGSSSIKEEGPNEIEARAKLALKIDVEMRAKAPAGWKGDEVKERIVQTFLHKLLKKDKTATLALFDLVKNQPGY